jgi:hypothetical protein
MFHSREVLKSYFKTQCAVLKKREGSKAKDIPGISFKRKYFFYLRENQF